MRKCFDAVFNHEVVLEGAPTEELNCAEGKGVGVGSGDSVESVGVVGADEGTDKPSKGVGVRGGESAL